MIGENFITVGYLANNFLTSIGHLDSSLEPTSELSVSPLLYLGGSQLLRQFAPPSPLRTPHICFDMPPQIEAALWQAALLLIT